MPVLADYPDSRPALLMDFANSRRVHPLMTFGRSTPGSFFGADGKIRTVAAHVPRINHDPVTGKCLGLLIEETRTNLVLQSSDCTASPWLGSATLSGDTEAGPDGVMAKGFTKSAVSGNRQQQFTSLAAGTYTISFAVWTKDRLGFMSFALTDGAGSATILRINIDMTTGAATKTMDTLNATVTSKIAGIYALVSVTLTTTATGLRLYCYPGKAETVDSTVGYLSCVQLEAGAFQTSYIATTTAQVTRTADVPRLNIGLSARRSLVAEFDSFGGYSVASDANQRRHIVALTAAAGAGVNDLVYMFPTATGMYVVVRDTALSLLTRSLALTSMPDTQAVHKVAISMNGPQMQGALDGVTGSLYTDILNTGNIIDTLTLGAQYNTRFLNGHLQRVAIYNTQLTAAQMAKLTAP